MKFSYKSEQCSRKLRVRIRGFFFPGDKITARLLSELLDDVGEAETNASYGKRTFVATEKEN